MAPQQSQPKSHEKIIVVNVTTNGAKMYQNIWKIERGTKNYDGLKLFLNFEGVREVAFRGK